jgi:DNA-binding NarL/FixJ family response regulator
MVVDDHPIIRTGLSSLIQSQLDLMVCGEAGDPTTAISRLQTLRPELMLADLSMPGRSGIEFIKDALALLPELKVLVLTIQNEQEYAERALRAGARGYIMKTAGGEQLLGAVRHVLAGGIHVSSDIAARLLQAMTGSARQHSISPAVVLSDRELEVFQLIGEGKDTVEMAAQLRISRKTVDVHRGAIKRKLGVSNSTALVRVAVRWLEDTVAATARPS